MTQKFHDYQMAPAVCPACGYQMDRAGDLGSDEPRAPEPGDVSVCLKCGEIMEFDQARQLRKLTELTGLPADTLMEVLELRRRVLQTNRGKA